MEVKAVYKYARISAKKMRDIAQEIQGLSVSQATDILSYTPKKGAYLLNKTLKSALANAENNAEPLTRWWSSPSWSMKAPRCAARCPAPVDPPT